MRLPSARGRMSLFGALSSPPGVGFSQGVPWFAGAAEQLGVGALYNGS